MTLPKVEAIWTPAEIKEVWRMARRRDKTVFAGFKTSEAQAVTLMRYHAKAVFRPSQFYVSFDDYSAHIANHGWQDHAGGLTPEAETRLAFWCIHRTIDVVLPRHEVANVLSAWTDEAAMEMLHAYLSRGTELLHNLSYVHIGRMQQGMSFIPKAAWRYVKNAMLTAAKGE